MTSLNTILLLTAIGFITVVSLMACLLFDFIWFPFNYITTFKYRIIKALKRGFIWLIGPRILNWFTRCHHYCVYEKNPFLSIFYFALILGVYFIFIFKVVPQFHRDPELISNLSIYSYTIVIIVSLLSWFPCRYASPGEINIKNHDKQVKLFPRDNIMYVEKICQVCNRERPARGKHCYTCGICVARHDHHCPWINNCVGLNNVRYFLNYLFMHVAACFYTVFICSSAAIGLINKYDLLNTNFRDGNGNLVPSTYVIVFQFFMFNYPACIGATIFSFIVGVTLTVFLIFHLSLVARNVTTRETLRLDDIRDYITHLPPIKNLDSILNSEVKSEEITKEQTLIKTLLNPDGSMDFSDKDYGTCNVSNFHCTKLPNRIDETMLNYSVEARKKLLTLIDIYFYNQGLIANFKEIFYPSI